MTWAYRKADPEDGSDTAGKEPVLMLHGLGSHSFCYRDLMRLLAAGGYTSYAPDWPGHGASSKVSPFECASFWASCGAFTRLAKPRAKSMCIPACQVNGYEFMNDITRGL